MTITLPLPPEVESKARNIPNLQGRLVTFVQHQVDLEQWRARRYSETARLLVKESIEEAEKIKQQGITQEEASDKFRAAYDKIIGAL